MCFQSQPTLNRRLAEAAGSGLAGSTPEQMFQYDGLPPYSPLILSLAATEADDTVPPEADALISAFIYELFEAHEELGAFDSVLAAVALGSDELELVSADRGFHAIEGLALRPL